MLVVKIALGIVIAILIINIIKVILEVIIKVKQQMFLLKLLEKDPDGYRRITKYENNPERMNIEIREYKREKANE